MRALQDEEGHRMAEIAVYRRFEGRPTRWEKTNGEPKSEDPIDPRYLFGGLRIGRMAALGVRSAWAS